MRGGVEYSAPEVINCEALTTAAGRTENAGVIQYMYIITFEIAKGLFMSVYWKIQSYIYWQGR
jgi:hypothetical protein